MTCRAGRIARALAGLGLWLGTACAAHAVQPVDLAQVQAIQSSALRPAQVDFSAAVPLTLPDNWRKDRPGFNGTVWYRVHLDAALQALGAQPAAEPLVLMVPRLADTGAMWLNDERLDLGATGGTARNQPLWVPLPRAALRPAGNVLHVRVQGSAATRGGLTELRLGPPAALRLAYETRWLFQTGVPAVLTFAVALSFFAAVPLWLKTRQHIFLLFTAMCLAWSPRALLILSPSASGPTPMGLFAALVGALICNVFILLLVIDLSGWHTRFWRRFVRFVWALTATVSVAALVLALRGTLRPLEAALLHLPFYAAIMIPLGGLIAQAWRSRGRSEVVMAMSFTVWLGAVTHDMTVAAGLLPLASFFVAPLPGLLVLLSLIWRTLDKMALERDGAQREISQAVAHASTQHGQRLIQLREEFDIAKETERQAVIAAERTRLLHDLHDGMGSQLITALRMTRRDEVPREEVARVIEDSLEDMRLIIDSLDLTESDLLLLLANLRYRLEPRLNAIGIGLQWQVGPLPEMDYLTPETGLSILRTLQEAINNAVRHGAARTITVRARETATAIELSVADDGCGFDTRGTPAPGKSQRGLAAMRLRAQKVGGHVRISSSAQGTCVTLALPLHR